MDLSEFPNFVVQEGSDDGKVTLSNSDRYTELRSGILFEEFFSGTKGSSIERKNQEVTICYRQYAQTSQFINRSSYKGPLAGFAKELNFKEDFTEAIIGMEFTEYRRFVIPPQINKTSQYKIVDVLIQSIKQDKADKVSNKEETEESKEKAGGYSIASIGGALVTAAGAAPVILQIIREIKVTLVNSDVISKDTESLPPKLRNIRDEETMYPARNTFFNQPQPRAEVGPKVTYRDLDGGDGEVISVFRQGCFKYKVGGSTEAIFFEGSATDLAVKLGPGFEEAILKAIKGMKALGSREIFIPRELSGLGENTVIKLKLKSINQRSRM
jgi:hypothetical protein